MFLVSKDNSIVISSDCIEAIFVDDECDSIYAYVGNQLPYALGFFESRDEAQAEFNNILGALVHSEQYPVYHVGGGSNVGE